MRVNRARLGLVVLMLPTLLVAMDITALLLALPRLSADLGASNVQQLWISDSYGLMVAGLVITMGTVGARPPDSCSSAGNCGWRRRCWTCGCSATARSRPYSSGWSSPASPWPVRVCS
jgi:MFS family permease